MERNVADHHERTLAKRQGRRAEAELDLTHGAAARLVRRAVVQAQQLPGAQAARVHEPLRPVGKSALELSSVFCSAHLRAGA